MTAKNKTESAVMLSIKNNAADFLGSVLTGGIAEASLKSALKAWAPKWDEYETARLAFHAAKPENLKDEAVRKQWSRLCKQSGVVIPKSTAPDALKKANEREAQVKALAALTDADLTKKIDLLKDNGLSASKHEKEIKRRKAEQEKPVKQEKDDTLTAIRGALAKADLATLKKIRALLKA